MTNTLDAQHYTSLLNDLKTRVATSRYKAALSVNKELILLYHHIGATILESQTKQGWGAKVSALTRYTYVTGINHVTFGLIG